MVFKLPKLLGSYPDWLEKQQSSILSAAAVITVASVFSSLAGILRQRLLMSLFLDGTQVAEEAFDALAVSFQVPDMMYQLIIIGALSAAFIPIFTSQRKKDEEQAFVMSSIMMNLLLFVFIAVGAVVFVFAPQITNLRIGHEYLPHQLEIVINLTRIMMVGQLFFAISSFFSGMLQSYQRFVIPSLAPILYNIGILIGVLLFYTSFGLCHHSFPGHCEV